ncbi:LacI family DNA-binding transcriptional regulator [Streptomyces sp. TRM 70351]|uniref:LacI family DNA-binding transcriptional regulator n=1 Tax=Streptomyces sp. TRM 70351 TaxID=3116552 RepID=UPI002E7B351E|nr:LacI family DNA-binding transcriptional regulator [Streptomyces sp. TRM 70351]MEE1928222.1 LacI family DNA-binding transcriptional regulator [Streptomyces sp. TRM 70351]
MAVTLADVAARAGVSAATVSRVLSGNYPVAGATRSRVLRAVEELEYVVNGPASALAAARSDLVGVLVHDVADPFFGVLAGAVQGALDPPDGVGGKLAVVCNTGGSPERELNYLTLLQRQRAAAVVLTGGAVADAAHQEALATRVRRLAAAGTRVVLCGRPPLAGEPDGALTLAFDNRGGARRLTEHLLALGHRAIGCVAGPRERTTTRDRLAGHHAALRAAGLPEESGPVVHGGYDRSAGYDGARELLRRAPGLTAVVAGNDTLALGVCAALRDAGLRVPQDVSVAGFDDLPFSQDAAPALTTVRLPLQEAGARAGRLALGAEEPPPGAVATVQAELMVRASTSAPRRTKRPTPTGTARG